MTKLISHVELKEKLDRDDDFKLVMVLGEHAYRAKHIPGTIHFPDPMMALKQLNKDDEIVVYCTDISCPASAFAYQHLTSIGYSNVRHFAEGLAGWEDAGYLLEGNMVK